LVWVYEVDGCRGALVVEFTRTVDPTDAWSLGGVYGVSVALHGAGVTERWYGGVSAGVGGGDLQW